MFFNWLTILRNQFPQFSLWDEKARIEKIAMDSQPMCEQHEIDIQDCSTVLFRFPPPTLSIQYIVCNVRCVSNTYNVRVRCVSNTRTYNVRVIFSQSEMSIMYILYHILKVWGEKEGVPAYKL